MSARDEYLKDALQKMQEMNKKEKRLSLDELREEALSFIKAYSQYIEKQSLDSSISIELNLESIVRVRLFISNVSKISFYTKEANGTYTKAWDGKFFNNPFPCLKFFVDNFKTYKEELKEEVKSSYKSEKLLKLQKEFISSYVEVHYPSCVYTIEEKDSSLLLTLNKGGEEKECLISTDNFLPVIKNL